MIKVDNDSAKIGAEGEIWIEILSWDWNLSVSMSSGLTPIENRFQGGLNYGRGFDLQGRILTPETQRDRTIRVWLSPFGAEMTFGPDEMDEVGRLYFSPSVNNSADLKATLLLPADAVAPLATCLASVSKYLCMTFFDPDQDQDQASIDRYAFSSTRLTVRQGCVTKIAKHPWQLVRASDGLNCGER